MAERKRAVNMTMSVKTRARIDGLKETLDSDSLSEVIRRSVELLEILTKRQIQGDKIILRSPDGSETEVIVTN